MWGGNRAGGPVQRPAAGMDRSDPQAVAPNRGSLRSRGSKESHPKVDLEDLGSFRLLGRYKS